MLRISAVSAKPRFVIVVAICGCLFSIAQQTMATPFIPLSGATVLETLPSRNDPLQKELGDLRTALVSKPGDLRIAVALSRRYVELWRDGGDPRYLGYAQAALGPWWNQAAPPQEARVMRATLLQSTHRFKEAMKDLDAVVERDRDNAQAWLTRATILQVLGDYSAARSSCERLFRLAPHLVAQTCLSGVESLSGDAAKGYGDLLTALKNAPDSSIDIQIWVLTLLAEIAERRADFVGAKGHFEKALALGVPDNYLLAAYADFLLGQGEPGKVLPLLKDKLQVDSLLLRYALALKIMGTVRAVEATKARDMLTQRFDAARLRGDTIHQREQTRFALELTDRPDMALSAAKENWAVQKEPADTRLMLQAALAAKDPKAARPVIDWIQKNRLEDHVSNALSNQLLHAAAS
jgi:Tfp pilus assembly protein PilF